MGRPVFGNYHTAETSTTVFLWYSLGLREKSWKIPARGVSFPEILSNYRRLWVEIARGSWAGTGGSAIKPG